MKLYASTEMVNMTHIPTTQGSHHHPYSRPSLDIIGLLNPSHPGEENSV
jgi:hypothetical protein